MPLYIVTIKMPKGHAGPHDAKDKQTGECDVSPYCTDVTGEHHSYLLAAKNRVDAMTTASDTAGHVTRIEEV